MESTTMNFAYVFDVGAAFVLAFFLIRGAMRGFTGEVISLVGLIVSVFCGWTYAKPMSVYVLNYFPTWNSSIVELICAIIIFIGVSLIFAVFGKMLQVIIKAASLSLLNHLAGAIAGSARAFGLVLFIYGAMSIFPIFPSEWMKDSIAMRGASFVWPTVSKIMIDNGWINPDSLKSSASDFENNGNNFESNSEDAGNTRDNGMFGSFNFDLF